MLRELAPKYGYALETIKIENIETKEGGKLKEELMNESEPLR